MELLARCLPLLVLVVLLKGADASSDEEKLVDHLLHHYNKIVRPGSIGDPVMVSIGVALIDVDIEEDVLVSRNWMRYMWQDTRLTWDTSKFSGITRTHIPVAQLWQPDIKLFNSLDANEEVAKDILAVVDHDGSVLYIPPANFRTRCDVTGRVFNCTMKFGSWTYSADQIDLKLYDDLEEFDTTDYVRSDKYVIESHPLKRYARKYPCCEELYPDIEGYIEFREVPALR